MDPQATQPQAVTYPQLPSGLGPGLYPGLGILGSTHRGYDCGPQTAGSQVKGLALAYLTPSRSFPALWSSLDQRPPGRKDGPP